MANSVPTVIGMMIREVMVVRREMLFLLLQTRIKAIALNNGKMA